MKKRAFAIAILLASLVTSIQAQEKNGWYLGTKMGWSHFNPLQYNNNIKNTLQNILNNNQLSKYNMSAPIVGLFLGYDFNPYFALEIENNTNGFFPHKIFEKSQKRMQFNSVQIASKLSYPITDDFHVYTKLGATAFWDDLVFKENLKTTLSRDSKLLPSIALGAEYVFNKKFITRLDYTWKNTVKDILDKSIKPSLGDAVLSFGWKFGKSDANDDMFVSDDSELSNEQYSVLNENINFPFNSTELKPISYDKINKLENDIKKLNLQNVSIILSGHSDRIGSKEYNQTLSEDRAYSIKNYLTSRGFPSNQITVRGMGQSSPLTNQVCKDIVNNKPFLISCLAPDRRVEIEILSTTFVE